ncbi:MAG: lysylphosphatidylglycerol synthase transmembrane domain-containing protein [Nitrospinota bacterium]
MKAKNRNFLLLIPTCVIFYILVKQVGLEKIMSEFYRADVMLLVCAFSLSLVQVGLSGQKLKLMIEMLGHKIGFSRCQKIVIATYAVNVVIPSKGGDFFKSWSIRDVVPLAKGVGIVLWERCLDVLLLCLMALLGGLFISHTTVISLSLAALAFLLLGSVLMLKLSERDWKGGCIKHVKGVSEVFRHFFIHKNYGMAVLVIGVLIWGLSALQVFVLYKAVGQSVPLLFSVAVVPVVVFVGFVPITVAGMGTRDVAFVFFFSMYASDSSSIAVAMFFSLFRYWLLALLGVPFLKHLYGNKLPNGEKLGVKERG